MEAHISLEDRLTVEKYWVTGVSPAGAAVHEQVRHAFANPRTYRGEPLEVLCAAFDRVLAAYEQELRLVDFRGAPLGRYVGFEPTPLDGRWPWQADWERAWLVLDDLRRRHAGDPDSLVREAAMAERGSELSRMGEMLGFLSMMAFCGWPEEAVACSRAAATRDGLSPSQAVWIGWLAGDPVEAQDLAAHVDCVYCEVYPPFVARAKLVAALRADWPALLTSARKPNLNRVLRPGAAAHTHVLVQLAHHQVHGTPSSLVVRGSFERVLPWFEAQGGWGFSPHLSLKLAHVAVAARWLNVAPTVLLADLGRRLHVIASPPPRTFRVPAEVVRTLTTFRDLAEDARRRQGALDVRLVGQGELELTSVPG
jgi:hypothetical protein